MLLGRVPETHTKGEASETESSTPTRVSRCAYNQNRAINGRLADLVPRENPRSWVISSIAQIWVMDDFREAGLLFLECGVQRRVGAL
jgi:hypothetical protein